MISFLPVLTIVLMFVPVLPTLLQDIIEKVDTWGNDGWIDPFVDILDVRISLTAHIYSGFYAEFSFLACPPHDRAYDHMS